MSIHPTTIATLAAQLDAAEKAKKKAAPRSAAEKKKKKPKDADPLPITISISEPYQAVPKFSLKIPPGVVGNIQKHSIEIVRGKEKLLISVANAYRGFAAYTHKPAPCAVVSVKHIGPSKSLWTGGGKQLSYARHVLAGVDGREWEQPNGEGTIEAQQESLLREIVRLYFGLSTLHPNMPVGCECGKHTLSGSESSCRDLYNLMLQSSAFVRI